MYFYHNELAQDEPKLVKLRQRLGYAGYGVYWALIERVHRTDSLSLEYDIDALAYSLQTDKNVLTQVICDFGLFEVDETKNLLTSVYLQSLTNKKPRKRKTTKTRNPNKTVKKASTDCLPIGDALASSYEEIVAEVIEEPTEIAEELPSESSQSTEQVQDVTKKDSYQRELIVLNDDYESVKAEGASHSVSIFDAAEQVDANAIEPVIEAWNEAYQGTKNTQNIESVKMNGNIVMQICQLLREVKPSRQDFKTVFDFNRKRGQYAVQFHNIFNVAKFKDILTRAQEERKREDKADDGRIYTREQNNAFLEKLRRGGLVK